MFLGWDLVSLPGRNYLQKVIQHYFITTPKVFWLPEFTKQKWWAWQGLNLRSLQCQHSVKAGSPPKLFQNFKYLPDCHNFFRYEKPSNLKGRINTFYDQNMTKVLSPVSPQLTHIYYSVIDLSIIDWFYKLTQLENGIENIALLISYISIAILITCLRSS